MGLAVHIVLGHILLASWYPYIHLVVVVLWRGHPYISFHFWRMQRESFTNPRRTCAKGYGASAVCVSVYPCVCVFQSRTSHAPAQSADWG